MLKQLKIENFALIDKLEINFEQGLCTITGETGAGKSILLGALSLLLGNRADTSVLKNKEAGCLIEGTFDIESYNLQAFFEENDLDYDDSTIVRRQIANNGKSRAFINEVPVNLQVLKEFALHLIDIHSQHENLSLSDSVFQTKVLDSIAGNQQLLNECVIAYKEFIKAIDHHKTLVEESQRLREEQDYIRFQVDQLQSANLIEGELQELESEIKQLTHAEEIKTGLATVETALNNDTTSAISLLIEAENALTKIANYMPSLGILAERLATGLIEIKDIAQEVSRHFEHQELDPDRLKYVQERLDLLYTLMQKHHCQTQEELLATFQSFKQKMESIDNSEEALLKAQQVLDEKKKCYFAAAQNLHVSREKVKPKLESTTVELLMKLGIPKTQFSVEIILSETPTPTGSDRVNFLFTANADMPMQEVGKVASGGEISRLMLAIKAQMATASELPTIVFDEIDTGVSGEVAHKMGEIIAQMAEKMQVINITHLPQIASKGLHHWIVYKENETSRTVTQIKKINSEERIVEIAKMLSGQQLTDAAMQNARELLKP
ncbi:MAG TPA: DNA repair protein RecN [Williamwhitmania sp.]|nr:DNA repair protein RecN [Williamwhitmania sp.]